MLSAKVVTFALPLFPIPPTQILNQLNVHVHPTLYLCFDCVSSGRFTVQISSCSRDSQTPPPRPPADGYCSGQYASYWNAFLFTVVATTNLLFFSLLKSFVTKRLQILWAKNVPCVVCMNSVQMNKNLHHNVTSILCFAQCANCFYIFLLS